MYRQCYITDHLLISLSTEIYLESFEELLVLVKYSLLLLTSAIILPHFPHRSLGVG